jgi:hypothetical protein
MKENIKRYNFYDNSFEISRVYRASGCVPRKPHEDYIKLLVSRIAFLEEEQKHLIQYIEKKTKQIEDKKVSK